MDCWCSTSENYGKGSCHLAVLENVVLVMAEVELEVEEVEELEGVESEDPECEMRTFQNGSDEPLDAPLHFVSDNTGRLKLPLHTCCAGRCYICPRSLDSSRTYSFPVKGRICMYSPLHLSDYNTIQAGGLSSHWLPRRSTN